MTTPESGRSRLSEQSGAPSTRSLLTSVGVHLLVVVLLLLIPARVLVSTERTRELEVVFYRARQPVEVPVTAVLPPGPRAETGGRPAPPVREESRPSPSAMREAPGPALPAAPAPVVETPQRNVGNAGILALRDRFASLSRDTVAPRLGADARYSAADEVGAPSARSALTTTTPGSSGGIDATSLSRNVGGGGGLGGGADGTGGAGGPGGGGVQVTRATSAITAVGGGDDRPRARSGPGAARTDEEIQIVFDRYKTSFYRLYNRELRNDPTLQGQMVLRLTIEPDGSVSMCELVSSTMDAPELAVQVVDRVRTINFGAKEGVQAVTIVYPIDFLPAA